MLYPHKQRRIFAQENPTSQEDFTASKINISNGFLATSSHNTDGFRLNQILNGGDVRGA